MTLPPSSVPTGKQLRAVVTNPHQPAIRIGCKLTVAPEAASPRTICVRLPNSKLPSRRDPGTGRRVFCTRTTLSHQDQLLIWNVSQGSGNIHRKLHCPFTGQYQTQLMFLVQNKIRTNAGIKQHDMKLVKPLAKFICPKSIFK